MGHLSWVSEVLSLGRLDSLDVSMTAGWQEEGGRDRCLILSWALYSSDVNSHDTGRMLFLLVGFTALKSLGKS